MYPKRLRTSPIFQIKLKVLDQQVYQLVLTPEDQMFQMFKYGKLSRIFSIR